MRTWRNELARWAKSSLSDLSGESVHFLNFPTIACPGRQGGRNSADEWLCCNGENVKRIRPLVSRSQRRLHSAATEGVLGGVAPGRVVGPRHTHDSLGSAVPVP